MNKKLVFGMSALILLAGFVGFQINDQDITPRKVINLISDKEIQDIQTFTEIQIIDTLFDYNNNQELIYENCTIKANQSYRIDRQNYNIYDAENNTLCLIKEIRRLTDFSKELN